MERIPKFKGLTKSEITRARQREIEDAWGGLTLGQAISSTPGNKKSDNRNDFGSKRTQPKLNEAIHIPSGSNIDFEMDMLDEPDRLAENLHHNYDILRESNAFDDEFNHYINEVTQKYNEFDEENKETDYWEVMQSAIDRQHTNARPAYSRAVPQSRTQANSSSHYHTDERPIRVNSNGQYNLNFIDWNNEWERAYEAMDMDDPDGEYIPGILNRDVEAFFTALGDNDETDKQGVREEIMKQLNIYKINSNKQFKKDDACSICLSNYSIGNKVVKLKCKHDFHIDCVKKWFEKNSTCPKCRADINQS